MIEKEKYLEDFNNGLHRLGRTLMVTTIILLIAVPFIFGAIVRLLVARRNGPGSSPEKIQKLRSPSAAVVFRREKKRKKKERKMKN